MTTPRCKECGKVSINEICIKCKHKRNGKKQFNITCIICGKESTTTKPREDYKCMKCR